MSTLEKFGWASYVALPLIVSVIALIFVIDFKARDTLILLPKGSDTDLWEIWLHPEGRSPVWHGSRFTNDGVWVYDLRKGNRFVDVSPFRGFGKRWYATVDDVQQVDGTLEWKYSIGGGASAVVNGIGRLTFKGSNLGRERILGTDRADKNHADPGSPAATDH